MNAAYKKIMEFDWREAKHKKNLEGRGFDFAAQIDDREDYGENRIKAIGEVDGVVLVVIYTDRDDVRWIISSRKASRKERALWHV